LEAKIRTNFSESFFIRQKPLAPNKIIGPKGARKICPLQISDQQYSVHCPKVLPAKNIGRATGENIQIYFQNKTSSIFGIPAKIPASKIFPRKFPHKKTPKLKFLRFAL
jgi:hypothetical protein